MVAPASRFSNTADTGIRVSRNTHAPLNRPATLSTAVHWDQSSMFALFSYRDYLPRLGGCVTSSSLASAELNERRINDGIASTQAAAKTLMNGGLSKSVETRKKRREADAGGKIVRFPRGDGAAQPGGATSHLEP